MFDFLDTYPENYYVTNSASQPRAGNSKINLSIMFFVTIIKVKKKTTIMMRRKELKLG